MNCCPQSYEHQQAATIKNMSSQNLNLLQSCVRCSLGVIVETFLEELGPLTARFPPVSALDRSLLLLVLYE